MAGSPLQGFCPWHTRRCLRRFWLSRLGEQCFGQLVGRGQGAADVPRGTGHPRNCPRSSRRCRSGCRRGVCGLEAGDEDRAALSWAPRLQTQSAFSSKRWLSRAPPTWPPVAQPAPILFLPCRALPAAGGGLMPGLPLPQGLGLGLNQQAFASHSPGGRRSKVRVLRGGSC